MARTVDLQALINAIPDGSALASQRLCAILASSANLILVQEAASSLGCSPQYFHALRTRVLRAALVEAEPKPVGRPSAQPPEEIQRLQQKIEELEKARVDDEIIRETRDLRNDMIALGMGHKLVGLKKNDLGHLLRHVRPGRSQRNRPGSSRPSPAQTHLRQPSGRNRAHLPLTMAIITEQKTAT